MKIVFVNRFFHPDQSATSQMLSDLAFALATRGHEVTVIASRLCHDNDSLRLPGQETVRNVGVIRLAALGLWRKSLFGRSLDYALFHLGAAWILLWRLRAGDILVAKTDPPLLSVLTASIARLKGARHVNWLQDVFPEVAAALWIGRGRLQRYLFAPLYALRNASLRFADCNVVLGPSMAAHIEGLGVAQERIAIIPNWADGRRIRPVAPRANALRKEWALEDAFVIGYAGTLGRAHSIEAILSAAAILERLGSEAVLNEALGDEHPPLAAVATASAPPSPVKGPSLRWLFIGGGVQMDRLERRAREMKLTSLSFLPPVPRERLCEALSVPDAHLVSLRPELEGLVVPSKIYGIAASGRPAIFIGDPNGDVARTITSAGIGFTVSEGDGAGLAKAVLALSRDRAMARTLGAQARRHFEAQCDLSLAVKAWERLISSIVSCSAKSAAGVIPSSRSHRLRS